MDLKSRGLFNAVCKVFGRGVTVGPHLIVQKCDLGLVNLGRYFCTSGETSNDGGNDALLRKEYQRMTAEERILFKLRKEISEATHDPEILTPEEHFYFLKMGEKCKNYVPVGRRGIYQGVILNMHLHWKKHQSLKVVVKTFSPKEVKEIAVELARLSGGIAIDIQDYDTIIMYRGKNYSQPPTEIMSHRNTLSTTLLDVFEKFPAQSNGDEQDFEEHLRQISSESMKEKSPGQDVDTPGIDEVDRMILQAASLLKKRGT
ncbi:unnamed protein product [Withania somnifera]